MNEGTQGKETWGQWLDRHDLSTTFLPANEGNRVARNQPWEVSLGDKDAAWSFLVELRSRIATRALPLRSGDETAALTSIYQLFQIFRRLAKRHPKSVIFTTLTLRMLDQHVRPFTSDWHRASLAGRLGNMDTSIQFRLELIEVQAALRRAVEFYAALLDISPAGIVCDAIGLPEIIVLPGLELAPGSADSAMAPVFASERVAVQKRREKVLKTPTTAALLNGIGLALSGGGIRSATFSLGVVTQLAQRGILDQIDYLSTVSGGGYLGAFITALLGQLSPAETSASIFGTRGAADTQPMRALRNHSRYLIEGGATTILSFLGLMLSGILASVLMVTPVIFLAAALIAQTQSWRGWIDSFLPTTALGLVVLGFVATLFSQRFWPIAERWIAKLWVASLILAAYLWIASRSLEAWLGVSNKPFWIVTTIIVSVSLIATLRLPRNITKRVLGMMLWFVGPALLIVAATVTNCALGLSIDSMLLIASSGLIFSTLVDLNLASPHRFYRDRVARTYILKTDANVAVTSTQIPLSQINASDRAPYHLINATLNIPGSSSPDNRGRGADFFLFSKYWCGSPTTAYVSTDEWERSNHQLSLASAVAISGAAAAPNMGMNDVSRYRQALALLNIRLDYWLKRPQRCGFFWAWSYFWHEMLGNMDEHLAYANVSDGGHIENLGIYELLRRQCKFIIAIDGEADPLRQFGSLVSLTQLAYVDLGVRIDPDLSNLRVDAKGIGRTHFEMFRIQYQEGGQGLLLYIKASLTGNESEFLRRYQQEHPDFPHESTAQQLYSERQFEAYRALGEHIARDLFQANLAGSDFRTGDSVEGWFGNLARNLLPREDQRGY